MKYPRLGFTWAATQIREEFSDDTWKAFWLTAVEEIEVDAAALALGHTRGSVYALRSRVTKRLKQKVE